MMRQQCMLAHHHFRSGTTALTFCASMNRLLQSM